MPNYTITLTDAEDKALSVVAISQQEWIENVVKNRCRQAKDSIGRLQFHSILFDEEQGNYVVQPEAIGRSKNP